MGMSNNGEVEYDGDSYYFSWDSARTVSDIARDPNVALSFQGSAGLLGKPPLFVAVEGTGRIVRNRKRSMLTGLLTLSAGSQRESMRKVW